MAAASAHDAFSVECDIDKPLKLQGTLVKWENHESTLMFHIDVKGPGRRGRPASAEDVRRGQRKCAGEVEQGTCDANSAALDAGESRRAE